MKNKIMKWAESNVNLLTILITILILSFINLGENMSFRRKYE